MKIALKREKKDVDCDLPTKTEAIVHVELSPIEREAYDCIHAFVTDYTMYLEEVAAGGMAGNQQAVLALITRLRQACLDLSLVPANKLVQLLSQSKKTTITNEYGTVNTDFSRFSESYRTALTDRLMRLFAAAGAFWEGMMHPRMTRLTLSVRFALNHLQRKQ
jgi:SNF2 family DNA or RNA helicase